MIHIVSMAAVVAALTAISGFAAELRLQPGDRIAIIGNTLADRMQHYGSLETALHLRFPKHELLIRNLGVSADELNVRPRSSNFGTPDQHLTQIGADVVLAFFGYNESAAGESGLTEFQEQLRAFITHTRQQRYNGESPPRLVLVSPIAHESLGSRLLPDGAESNRRLALYTQAMKSIADQMNVPFVDLFHPMAEFYTQTDRQLTINGIHPNELGYERIAGLIDQSLFGDPVDVTREQFQRVRESVLDKNLHWFNVYRRTNAASDFGNRSSRSDVDRQPDREVMHREREILEAMTTARDRVIWARAQGRDASPDDSRVPEMPVAKTDHPGLGPDGNPLVLDGEEAISRMTVPEGLQVNLFASEQEFADLVNPAQMAIDPDGRLWVATWPAYPDRNPRKGMTDKLIILPDENGDGRADRGIVWADKLRNPTGFAFWGGGVLLAQAPDILFLKDIDGDDRADIRLRLLHGIDSADPHHAASSFVIGPDGALYFQQGAFQVTNTESVRGKPFRSISPGVFRFDPRTLAISQHCIVDQNPHGDVFDRWGNQFVTNGTSGDVLCIGFPGRGAPPAFDMKHKHPVTGLGILSSTHFPERYRDTLLVCNVTGPPGIAQYNIVDHGGGFLAEEAEPLLVSSDPNFYPSAVDVGADGAVYVLDRHNAGRSQKHGRVYRVTARGTPLLAPRRMRDRPIPELLTHLSSPNLGERRRVRVELSSRNSDDVIQEAQRWLQQFDPKRRDDVQQFVEVLWLHQQHKIENLALLQQVLDSREPNARTAAVRVLRDWIRNVPDARGVLLRLARDEHPRVRAEAIVAAVNLSGDEAAEILIEAMAHERDTHLDFVLNEAMKLIDVTGYIDQCRAGKRPLTPAVRAYLLTHPSQD